MSSVRAVKAVAHNPLCRRVACTPALFAKGAWYQLYFPRTVRAQWTETRVTEVVVTFNSPAVSELSLAREARTGHWRIYVVHMRSFQRGTHILIATSSKMCQYLLFKYESVAFGSRMVFVQKRTRRRGRCLSGLGSSSVENA